MLHMMFQPSCFKGPILKRTAPVIAVLHRSSCPVEFFCFDDGSCKPMSNLFEFFKWITPFTNLFLK